MTLEEQIPRRVAGAHRHGRRPLGWVATPTVVDRLQLGDGEYLEGLPVEIGKPRSEYGLDLVCERRA